MLGWIKQKLESKMLEEISVTLDRRWHHPMEEGEDQLKSFLMKVKQESEKVGLKLNI